jgi:hypothetical protein
MKQQRDDAERLAIASNIASGSTAPASPRSRKYSWFDSRREPEIVTAL